MGHSPAEARELGVAVLHQDRKIAPDLSVTENLLLGRLPTLGGRVSWGRANREAKNALDDFGLELNPRTLARELSPQQRQEIELVRALYVKARVVIMDEPSAALAGEGFERLYASVRRLRDSGVAVVYISHHLKEVFDISDRITVMRDGQRVGTFSTNEQTHDGLVRAMFGEVTMPQRPDSSLDSSTASIALRATDLVCGQALRGVSLHVREGEILGVVGAVGSGRRELARCLAGIQAPDAGQVVRQQQGKMFSSPSAALAAGVAMVPEDRKREGLLPDLSIADNIALSRRSIDKKWLVRPRRERRIAGDLARRLNIKAPGVTTVVGTLSGGNQQKVLLARCLRAEANVLVLDEADRRHRCEVSHGDLQPHAGAGQPGPELGGFYL